MGGIQPGAGAEWLNGEGYCNDVVLSSRVRLARNFAGYPFVNSAASEDLTQIIRVAERHILSAQLAPQMLWVDLLDLPEVERLLLVERHLISTQHARGECPRALAVSSPDERLAIMINEEDHLRIQFIRSGLSLTDAYERINDVDDRIESHVDFAFSSRFGYLTACPTNVGTGIRVSVMVHLPALKLTGELEKVRRAAKAMNLAIRGFYGEGSEAAGDFFQISNQTTLGKTESQIVTEFERHIPKFIEYERIARRKLTAKRSVMLEDKVFRAYGTLRHARLLRSEEALELLSYVRLGISMELIDDIDAETVNRLVLLTQPAHLQKVMREELTQARRRVERASLVRRHLNPSD
ncbi:MAG: protein arginine kinase [Phycisphaerales bacterium]